MITLAKPIVAEHLVHVAADAVTLDGNLRLPEDARAVVLFAHGSGSGRHSSRNRHVAQLLNEAKLATLLIDLLTANEEAIDLHTAHLRFDIELLARRLVGATDWLTQRPDTRHLPIGEPLSHAAGGRIWRGRPCPVFARPRCSSSVETMSR